MYRVVWGGNDVMCNWGLVSRKMKDKRGQMGMRKNPKHVVVEGLFSAVFALYIIIIIG